MTTTLRELQKLDDGQFHGLGDAILRDLDSRYRQLRTHGLNEHGQSIVGQPDSYVGATYSTCTVAVCYTVQKKGWWTKVVSDINAAMRVSPSIVEVVAVIAANADRDGPKDNAIDWLSDAKTAAKRAALRIIDGRELAEILDTKRQEIRHQFLNIPYSRLSGLSIFAGAQAISTVTIDAIRTSGRYDPLRYCQRSADRELYSLWQQGLGHKMRLSRTTPVRMIALVNDSGTGKTSLACSFAQSLSRVLPVVLVQARDISFISEDSLVAYVINSLQGVLEPNVRVGEEAALTYHLSPKMPLTLVVDGLDESDSADRVRRAITYWLRSKIGSMSTLIVTSRTEFWRICSDRNWGRWMPSVHHDDDSPVVVAENTSSEKRDPHWGLRLPARFTEDELEIAWAKGGLTRPDLYRLPIESREALRHPFTLRIYLDLCAREIDTAPSIAQTDLIAAWLNNRLDAETDPAARITRELFHDALRIIAVKLATENGGAIAVDKLINVPRFDPVNPPGALVQRLIQASILETVPGHPNLIRFGEEAVHDFFRAEADVEAIKVSGVSAAEEYAQLRFTAAYPRLARLGRRLMREEARHLFVERLLELNPAMASIVVSAQPSSYPTAVRSKIASGLSAVIQHRYRVRAAFSITMLGRMDCPEAVYELKSQVFSAEALHPHLKAIGADALATLGDASTAPMVFRWGNFGIFTGNSTYYFPDTIGVLRYSKPVFRKALGDSAFANLDSHSGKPMHARAVYVLAAMGDDRVVSHLKDRLTQNGLLHQYENHALIAAGTDGAGLVFADSVRAVADRLATLPDEAAKNSARHSLIYPVQAISADTQHLMTSAFALHLVPLLRSENSDISWIACDLVKRAKWVPLFFEAAAATARQKWFDFPDFGERNVIPSELWLAWWQQASEISLKRKLLKDAPNVPSVEVEAILSSCLDVDELRPPAAKLLGEYGAVRSAPSLRLILTQSDDTHSRWAKLEAARALGDLRDEQAVPLLSALAASNAKGDIAIFAISSLGVIGGTAAEQALCELLRLDVAEDQVAAALIVCGTATAVEHVVAHAETRSDGVNWLCQQLGRVSWTRGWRLGEYYIHIQADALIEYLDANYRISALPDNWDFVRALQKIDSSEVRKVLRKWVVRASTDQDALVHTDNKLSMSHMCAHELMNRGDDFAIPYILDERADAEDGIYVSIAADNLRHFSSPAVAIELRKRLLAATEPSQFIRLISLLGRFGDISDEGLLERFCSHSDDLVCNVACESKLRLTDPLLVPAMWREV